MIGRKASRENLLESILFPSASYARGYEPYLVATQAGKVYPASILRRQTADAIYLVAGDLPETTASGAVAIATGTKAGITWDATPKVSGADAIHASWQHELAEWQKRVVMRNSGIRHGTGPLRPIATGQLGPGHKPWFGST